MDYHKRCLFSRVITEFYTALGRKLFSRQKISTLENNCQKFCHWIIAKNILFSNKKNNCQKFCHWIIAKDVYSRE